MAEKANSPRRILAALLAAALVLVSPGFPAYQALAATVSGGGPKGPSGPAGQAPGEVPRIELPALPAAAVPAAPTAGVPGALTSETAAEVPGGVVSGSIGSAPSAPSGARKGPPPLPVQVRRMAADNLPSVIVSPELAREGEAASAPAQEVTDDQVVEESLVSLPSGDPNAVTQKIPREAVEAAKALAQPKAEKAGALSWLFDRFRSRAAERGPRLADPAWVSAAAPSKGAPALAPASGQGGSGDGGRAAPPPPPGGGEGGDGGGKPGRWQRLKEKFSLKGYDRSEKSYIMGQAIFITALSIYVASLPLLVKALTGSAEHTGTARTVHYWVLAAGSLFAGKVVQKLGMMKVLKGGSTIRAVIYGTIGVLALAGLMPWPLFVALVGVNALVVAHTTLVDLDEGGAARVMTSDEKVEKSGYLYDTLFNLMLLIVPPLVGLGMDWLDAAAGEGIGAKAAFASFAAVMLLAVRMYDKVKVIKDETSKKLLGHWQTVKLIYRNVAIRTRWLMMTAENFLEDALFSVVLPVYAVELLHQGGFGNGVLLSGKMFGGLLAGAAMARWALPIQKRVGAYQFLLGLTVLASVAFLPTVGLWLAPSLWVAVPVALLMKLLYQPIRSRMRALLQLAIKHDPVAKDHDTEVFSLMNFTALIAAGAGGLAFELLFLHSKPGSFLFEHLGAMAPMKVVTAFLAFMSLVYIVGLRWMKGELLRTERKVHPGRGTMTQAFEEAQRLLEDDPAAAAEKLASVQKRLLGHLAAPSARLASLRLHLEAQDSLRAGSVGSSAALARLQAELEKFSEEAADGIEQAKAWAASGHPSEAAAVLRSAMEGLPALEANALEIERARRALERGHPSEAGADLARLRAGLPALEEGIALSRLSQSLERMGLEPYRTGEVEEPVDPDRPTAVILSPASVYKLSIAREGGRQSAGDVHLALDPSWLVQEVAPDGKARLFLKKGVTFDRSGRAVVVTYKTPRTVRYFANFYTLGGNDRDDGVPLERGLDLPQSNSVQLEKTTNDKLLTRLMLAAKGVAVPATVAFLMASHPLKARAAELGGAGAGVHVASMPGSRDEIRSRIEEFLRHYAGEEVVVKPSGPQFHSSVGVRFFPREDVEGMVDHVVSLSKDPQMTPEGAVLVDERLTPPAIYLRTGEPGAVGFLPDAVPMRVLKAGEVAGAEPSEKKDWNLRVQAARAPWGGGVGAGIFSRAGRWGIPTVGEPKDPKDAAAIVSLETVIEALREQHGLLKTPEEAAAFKADLESLGARAVEALAAAEAGRSREDGEPRQAQTDFIGLDVMVVSEGGRLVPKIIEVNDHDSGGQWQYDSFHPEDAGGHSRAWVATMLARARRDALKGKRIVLVGAGPPSKRAFLERARELGVEVVLVDKGLSGPMRLAAKVLGLFGVPLKDHWARDLVSEFVAVDTAEPDAALAAARKKLQRSARKNGRLDGITTYWEDDVVLTSRLAKDLDLSYHPVASAAAARNKYETRRVMAAAGLPSAVSRFITNREDLERAIQNGFPFPAVLKPARGAEAMLTVRVDTPEQALAQYGRIASKITIGMDAIYKEGSEVILDQYIEGREWDADLVLQDGRLVYSSVTDNWPTREPYFVATGASLPSREFSPSEQAAVVAYAVKSLEALGFRDGVFHMEGKTVDGRGPRLIEANVRPGGSYVVPWNEAVNGVDLAELLYATAAGIPLSVYKAEKPRAYLEGEFIMPERSGTLKVMRLPEEVRAEPGFHELVASKAVGSRLEAPYKARAGLLAARGRTAAEARRNLEELKAKLVLEVEYDKP